MSKPSNAYWVSPALFNTLDMTVPALVFGGLLAAAIAFCGGLDAAPPANRIGLEPQVANDENVIGYYPNEPVTSCGRERGQMGQRCRETSGVIRASMVQ